MHEALRQAQKAFDKGEVPIGAIIVFQKQIIAAAHNLCLRLNDATAHAEVLAIRQALQHLGQPYLLNCDMYVTLEPCSQCAGALALSRIKRVYFGAYDPKGGGVEHGAKVFKYSLHKPEIIGGVYEEQSDYLLKSFFQKKR
jgi:tRNA(adenine34) deaminase